MTYVLTLPDQKVAKEATANSNCSGNDELAKLVSKQPLSLSERGSPRNSDHVHLSRFIGTDYCQWFGRQADGYHRPIGRIMQVVRVAQ
jgi:hypothetical protein